MRKNRCRVKPEERDCRAHRSGRSQRNCKVQGNADRLHAQPKTNGGDSVAGAERDYQQKRMPDFHRLICRKQVRHGGQSYYPRKHEHRQHCPKSPDVFPFPAIHETGWRGETSVEYARSQRQCCGARGCDKKNCGWHH